MRMADQQHLQFRALLPAAPVKQVAEAAWLEKETQDARDTFSSKDGSPLSAGGPRGPSAKRHSRALAACFRCRRSKAKCTGARPSCRRCTGNNYACEYDADPDTTRVSMLRRRNQDLTRENEDLRALIAFLSNRPLTEAEAVFQRLREQQQKQSPPAQGRADPLDILTSIRGAELLLSQGRPATTAAEEGRQGCMFASYAARIAADALFMINREPPQAGGNDTTEGRKE
ncbi:hypothetical protein RB596_000208 [Gaeumannomyces avenae]